jgi:hypothetical protein
VKPTKDHIGKYAVTLEPIAKGKIGKACVWGVCPVRLMTNDPHTDPDKPGDRFAELDPNDPTGLQTGTQGSAEILDRGTGTGSVWGFVRIGPQTPTGRFFTLTADFTTGETAAVRWWAQGSDGKATKDTGKDGEVVDAFSWWPDAKKDTKGYAERMGGVWVIKDLYICSDK